MDKRLTGLMEQWEFEVIAEDAVQLKPEDVEQAMRQSQVSPQEADQWQTYLNTLAQIGFQRWLESRASDVLLEQTQPSLPQLLMDAIPANGYWLANQFKLCLIAIEGQPDEVVHLSRAAIDLPDFTAQFYVLIRIYEEQAQAIVHSFVSYDQLVAHRLSLAPQNWTYSIPLTWFNPDINRLLLYLRCADPAALLLPTAVSSAIALTNMPPELLNLVSQGQGTADKHPSDLLQLLTQPVMNLAPWLDGQMDRIAQKFSWVLLPPLASGSPLRSGFGFVTQASKSGIEAILTQLERKGLQLPPEARVAYRCFKVGTIAVQLYLVTGVFRDAEPWEWSVLVILCPQSGSKLPDGTTLRLSDVNEVLVQQSLDQEKGDHYLFAQVSGTCQETFLVRVMVPGGASVTLPPLGFQLEG